MNTMKKRTALGSSSYLGIHPHAPCAQKDDHVPTTVVLNDSHPYVGSKNTLEVSHEPSSCTEKKEKVKRVDEKETEDKISIYLFDCRENSTINTLKVTVVSSSKIKTNMRRMKAVTTLAYTHTHTHTLSLSLALALALPPS